METKSSNFWWLKSPLKRPENIENLVVPKLDLNSTSSLSELLDKESDSKATSPDADVGSILEEINRVAAQSPLGPFEKSVGDRSIDDIMREAEKVYMESSKSFEQLSQHSKTSQNITDFLSSHSQNSTPTPKSVSPLPMDHGDSASEYSDDFSQESKKDSHDSLSLKGEKGFFDAQGDDGHVNTRMQQSDVTTEPHKIATEPSHNNGTEPQKIFRKNSREKELLVSDVSVGVQVDNIDFQELKQEITFRNRLIETLEEDNRILKGDIEAAREKSIPAFEKISMINKDSKHNETTTSRTNKNTNKNTEQLELEHTHTVLQKIKSDLKTKTLSSPEINLELEKSLEELKDAREINTALQLQLDATNKTHQHLKSSYEDLLASNKALERKVHELESSLTKYKTELFNVQKTKDKLVENESNLNKLLEIEKLQSKSLKLQNEKDSRCIQDLNRQIKEMERIIARKHPDSVSALIVAAKEDATDTNLTARKILEDRIRTLELEVVSRDSQSSKVCLEIQEKFNQMKNKYESHIDDLELHVNDLKDQLKKRLDTFDVYTQTIVSDEKIIPQKETYTVCTQTDAAVHQRTKVIGTAQTKKAEHARELKEDAHLLATIRGLQADLANKEKVIARLQREIEEVRKTNKRLQKEREGSLRNLSDRKEFRSYPEKLAAHSRSSSAQDFRKDEELQQVKAERDRLKQQLSRLEEDYQNLKKKRLDDLTTLQEAHEREVANYVHSVTPLREQLELQQVSIATFQSQLSKAKEELTIATIERDHLSSRYKEKIKLINDVDPFALQDGELSFMVDDFPKIEFVDIVAYLVFTHSFYAKEQIKAHKSLACYKYLESGFVIKTGTNNIKDFVVLVERYKEKIKLINDVDPFALQDGELSFMVDDFPKIEFVDIVAYLVFTHSFYAKEQIKAHKSLACYKYLESGFVIKTGTNNIKDFVVLVERLLNSVHGSSSGCKCEAEQIEVQALLKKIALLEKQYEEKEYRLRAIVHSLAQKNITNRCCEQCAERQRQLISYKVELDQLLASVRALQSP